MRAGWIMRIALSLALCLVASTWAEARMRPPREAVYQGKRMWVRIAKGQMTKVIFPDPLPTQPFPVHAHEVVLSRDALDARQLIIQGIDPPDHLEFTVNTTRQPYLIVLKRDTQAPDSVVTVVHPPLVEQAAMAHIEAPRFPPIRSLWITQWRGDPGHPEPGVTLRPVQGTLADNAEQSLTYRHYIEGFGHYGWTLTMVNKTPHPKALQVEQIRDPAGQLVSIIVQHPGRLSPDMRSHHIVQPQETVLLHLLYQEEGR